jgi:hypothetical protein
MSARIFMTGLLLLSLGAAAPQTTTRSSSRSRYSEHYGLLEDRNIFVRERSTRRPGGRNSSTTQPAPRPPEEKYVLRGTVLEEDGYRAYVEDTDRFETLRLAPGDKLARGRVAAIMIDAIAYEPSAAGSQRAWIEVGSDLTGKASKLAMSSSSSPTTAPTTGPVVGDVAGLNPNDPNLTPEQRMKLRRAMELQKK